MIPGDIAHELTIQILKSRMAFRQAIQRELKRNNVEMTFEMLQIMYRLWIQQGVSQQHLAQKTAKDKACLTNLINNLEKKGWVIRKEDADDRRNRLIFLTAEGEALSRQVKPLLHTFYEQVGEKMNREAMLTCLENLKKLNETFDEI